MKLTAVRLPFVLYAAGALCHAEALTDIITVMLPLTSAFITQQTMAHIRHRAVGLNWIRISGLKGCPVPARAYTDPHA